MKALILAFALMGAGVASADIVPPPSIESEAAKPITLNELAASLYGGAWLFSETKPDGSSMSMMINLKADMTYQNSASGKSAAGAPISAIGQGYWFARIAADGGVEIALTRDAADQNPSWVMKPSTDGRLIDGEKVWTR